jgi:DNA-binding Lrp family transcriptional regulator
LENVFVDLGAHVSSEWAKETVEKTQRQAFIFITAQSNSSTNALQDLKQIDAVKEVYLSRGAYDIVAKVSGESIDHLREIVATKIKNISSIKSTLTLMIL